MKNDRHYCVKCNSKTYEKYMFEVITLAKTFWVCDACIRKADYVNLVKHRGDFIDLPGLSSAVDNSRSENCIQRMR